MKNLTKRWRRIMMAFLAIAFIALMVYLLLNYTAVFVMMLVVSFLLIPTGVHS